MGVVVPLLGVGPIPHLGLDPIDPRSCLNFWLTNKYQLLTKLVEKNILESFMSYKLHPGIWNLIFNCWIHESVLTWHFMRNRSKSFNSRPLYLNLKWFIVDLIMNLIRPHLKFHTENCENVICIFVSGIFRLKKYFHFTKVLTLF